MTHKKLQVTNKADFNNITKKCDLNHLFCLLGSNKLVMCLLMVPIEGLHCIALANHMNMSSKNLVHSFKILMNTKTFDVMPFRKFSCHRTSSASVRHHWPSSAPHLRWISTCHRPSSAIIGFYRPSSTISSERA
jgi:hypothetical protein